MAILKNGILGGVSGKVSGVVGFNWRGIDVIRSYAKPSNPNSAAQQTQRTKFAYTVKFAKNILSSIINKFWLNKNSFMSPYNSFMKANIAETDATNGIDASNVISQGSLEGASKVSSEYNSTTGLAEMIWSPTCTGNGLPTDNALAVVYDRANNVAFVSDAEMQRTDEGVQMNIGTGRTATDLVGFYAFYRGSAPDYLVSTSIGTLLPAV